MSAPTRNEISLRLARMCRWHPGDPAINDIRRDLNAARIRESVECYGADLHESDRRRLADLILSGSTS